MILEGGFTEPTIGQEWVKSASATTVLNIDPPLDINVGYVGMKILSTINSKVKDIKVVVKKGGTSSLVASGGGASIYGFHILFSQETLISRVEIETGNAAKGRDGLKGQDGENGVNGGSGVAGDNDDEDNCKGGGFGGRGGGSFSYAYGVSNCGGTRNGIRSSSHRVGGSGAPGGSGGGDPSNFLSGPGGSGGPNFIGLVGGFGGSPVTRDGCDPRNGRSGFPGLSGSTPVNTFSGPATLKPENRNTQYFIPGNGARGGDGYGGSGGGGGSGSSGHSGTFCIDGTGSSGGGGGGGGQGGQGGEGGKGGGSTIGIWSYDSPNTYLLDSIIKIGTAGEGGSGGVGGIGGRGGSGAAGGNGDSETGNGGRGASGGNGGDGNIGQEGAPGMAETVWVGAGQSITPNGVSIPKIGLKAINRGCTNSEIILERPSNNQFDLTNTQLTLINDLSDTETSFEVNDLTAKFYTPTTGDFDIFLNPNIHLKNFVSVAQQRQILTPNNIDSEVLVCLADSKSVTAKINIPFSTDGYAWSLYEEDDPNTIIAANDTQDFSFVLSAKVARYIIKLQTFDQMCGWSIPVFKTLDAFTIDEGYINVPPEGYCPTLGPQPIDVFPLGGVWRGPLASKITSPNLLNPSLVYPSGTYNITYDISSENCIDAYSTLVTILPRTNITFDPVIPNFEFCDNDASIEILVSPTPGRVTGTGFKLLTTDGFELPPVTAVTSNVRVYFDPKSAGVGSHTIKYSYTDNNDCLFEKELMFKVFPTEPASFSGLESDYCLNQEPLVLVGSTNLGNFTGDGITQVFVEDGTTKAIWDPQVAGNGTHFISFFIDGNSQCAPFNDTKSVVVRFPPEITWIGVEPQTNSSQAQTIYDVCFEEPVALYALPEGGFFNGTGVINSTFYPYQLEVSNYTISYIFEDNQSNCSTSSDIYLNILEPLDIELSNFVPVVCFDNPQVMDLETNYPGNFSGPGLNQTSETSAIFDHNGLPLGPQNIVFRARADDGCYTTVKETIWIFDEITFDAEKPSDIEDVEQSPDANLTVCVNGQSVPLVTFPPHGLTYSSPVSSSIVVDGFNFSFVPSEGLPGLYALFYFLNFNPTGNCSYISDTLYIRVLPIEEPSISGINENATICINEAPINLGGSPSRKSFFTGPGIRNGTSLFDPSQAGQGEHTIVYSTLLDNGCRATTTINVTVIDTVECVKATAPAKKESANLTWIYATGGSLGFLLIVALVVLVFVYKRRKRLSDDEIRSELELRGDDILAASTVYQKIPGMKIDRAIMEEVFGSQSYSWEIKMNELEIEKEIGRGAYGIVYKARWRNENVAVKQMIGGDETEEQLKEFTKEVKIMTSLRPHKAVVQMLGIVVDPLCIVTNFYENGSLLSLLQSDIKIDMKQNIQIMRGIASGMKHLHAENLVHRDLAARNILLDKDFEPVVADFGLSRTVQGNKSAMTKSEVGPLKWMAPESLMKQSYSFKSDVYTFGILCWEIIARSEPYPDLEPMEVAFGVREGLRPEIPEFVPHELRDLLNQCWKHDPQERPSFEGVLQTLDSILKNGNFN